MTTIDIAIDAAKKKLKVSGDKVAAGEPVSVTVTGLPEEVSTAKLRLRVLFGGHAIAVFPPQAEDESWDADDSGNPTCTISLNTDLARYWCRGPETECLWVLDDTSDVATPSSDITRRLWGVGVCPVQGWPALNDDTRPFNLCDLKSQWETWNEQFENIGITAEQKPNGVYITFKYKDGHTETRVAPRGPQGEKGEKGDRGEAAYIGMMRDTNDKWHKVRLESNGNEWTFSAKQETADDDGTFDADVKIPVTGAVARSLESRFADVVYAKDFGAKVDDAADDATSLAAAVFAAGHRSVSLSGGTCKTSVWPDGNFTDGYIDFGGRKTNLDGVIPLFRNGCAQEEKFVLSTVNGAVDGDPWSPTAGASFNWPQSCAYIKDGNDEKLFIVREVNRADSSDYNAYGLFVISEYSINTPASGSETLTWVSDTDPLPLGHGQGFGTFMDDDKVYFVFDEAGNPNRDYSSTANCFIGVTIVEYHGSGTTAAHCTSWRLRDLKKTNSGNTDYDKCYASPMVPTVTPDGKHLIVMSGGRIRFYKLADILDCETAVGSDDSNASVANYTQPGHRYDATAILPVREFFIDTYASHVRQGICCDTRYIYISSGQGASKSTPHKVEVYDYAGRKVADIAHTNVVSQWTDAQLAGDVQFEGAYIPWQIAEWENEGMFLRGDKIYTLAMLRQTAKTGQTFTTTNTANIWAIGAPESGNAAQVPVNKNGLEVTHGPAVFDDLELCLASGKSIKLSELDPKSGKRTPLNVSFGTDSMQLRIGTAYNTKPLILKLPDDTEALRIWHESGTGEVLGAAGRKVLYLAKVIVGNNGSYEIATAIGLDTNVFFPLANGTVALGNNDHRWADVFIAGISGSNTNTGLKAYLEALEGRVAVLEAAASPSSPSSSSSPSS